MSVRSDGERLKLCLPTAHLLLCGPIPNRPLMDRSVALGFGDPCSYGWPCGYDLFRKWGLSRWTQGEVIVEWGDLSEEGRLETDTKEGWRPVETQSLQEEVETQARTSRQGGWKKERALPPPRLQRSTF